MWRPDSLKRRLPKGARSWGAARKALNIFLRDVLYNHYLRSHHGLDRLEDWLEVPLDRDVAVALRAESEGGELPRWKTIKRLTPDVSGRYQAHCTAGRPPEGNPTGASRPLLLAPPRWCDMSPRGMSNPALGAARRASGS